MQTVDQVLGGGVQKGDHSKLVKAFAEKKGYKPKNAAQWKFLFSTQGKAAKLLLEMAGDLNTALKALDEIGDYLTRMETEKGWESWKNLNAVCNHLMEWEKENEGEAK